MNWIFLAVNVGFAVYWLHEWDHTRDGRHLGLFAANCVLVVADVYWIAKEIL